MQAIHDYPPGRPQSSRTSLNARLADRFQTNLVAVGKVLEPTNQRPLCGKEQHSDSKSMSLGSAITAILIEYL
jgi:hypothetical protein